jgi:hypothetical protein
VVTTVVLIAIVCVSIALTLVGVLLVRARARRPSRRMRTRAVEVSTRAEALSDLADNLSIGRATTIRRAWYGAEQSRLSEAVVALNASAQHPAFRRAMTELVDALSLLDQAVAQSTALQSVPNIDPDDIRCSIAASRLHERSQQVRSAARFMAVVAEFDGC